MKTTVTATAAIAPALPWPTNELPTWADIYGIPAETETVTSSIIENPDQQNPGTAGTPVVAGKTVIASISNPTPYWWPDLTGLTQGSWHDTPYTGPPQPITN